MIFFVIMYCEYVISAGYDLGHLVLGITALDRGLHHIEVTVYNMCIIRVLVD
jgi:hypothetical protein